VAVGPEDSGMHLFAEVAGGVQAVVVGFGLEMGLRDFYLTMEQRTNSQATKELFAKLAEIEIVHQQQLLQLYGELTGETPSLEEFAAGIVAPAMEGGLSTEDYLRRYQPDLDKELEVLSLAMAIEAQALDLYLRAAEKSDTQQGREVLQRIAQEERGHIARLGAYIDNISGQL
jgi:rubrerythrin